MKILINVMLLLIILGQSFIPAKVFSKSKGVPFYRIFFTEQEWKKEYPDIPKNLGYLPENIFKITDPIRFKILFGSFDENETLYKKMIENNFFPEDMHQEAIDYLNNNDRNAIYRNIKDFFVTYSGDKYNKIQFDIKFVARQTFILNHYYFKYDNRPEVLTTLYYAYNLLFKLTADSLNVGFYKENVIYQDYLLFKNNKIEYLSGKDLKNDNLSLKILNFFCYGYIENLNKLILKNNPENEIALRSLLNINRYFKWHNKKYLSLERLLKLKPLDLNIKLELLRSYYFLGKNNKYNKLIKDIRIKHPGSEKMITPIENEVMVTKKLTAWENKYKYYKENNFTEKWYELVELLIKNNKINELNKFFPLATSVIKKEKKYELLLLEFYSRLCMDFFMENSIAKILNPNLFMQQILNKGKYIDTYYRYTLMMANKYPANKNLFDHIVNSSFLMTFLDLIKKGVELKIVNNQRISDKQISAFILIIKEHWKQTNYYLKKVYKSRYQEQIMGVIARIEKVFLKYLGDPKFLKIVTDEKSLYTDVLKIIWDDLIIISHELSQIDWTLDPQQSDALFVTFSFKEIYSWIKQKNSLERFIEIKEKIKQEAKGKDENGYNFVKFSCKMLLEINKNILRKYSNFPGLKKTMRKKNRKQVKEVNQFALSLLALIEYLEGKEKLKNNDIATWKISHSLLKKISEFKKRYLYEKYLINYCKGKYMLKMYKKYNNIRYINAAYYYLNKALITVKDRESVEMRKAGNMILFQEDINTLENEIYQNIGFCLNYYKNINARYFISYAGAQNKDERLNIVYFMEQQYAVHLGDRLKLLEIFKKTYNSVKENDKIAEKTKNIYLKSLAKNILILLEKDKGINKDSIKEYNLILKSLKDVDDIKSGTMGMGGGGSSSEGLSFFIHIHSSSFMVEL